MPQAHRRFGGNHGAQLSRHEGDATCRPRLSYRCGTHARTVSLDAHFAAQPPDESLKAVGENCPLIEFITLSQLQRITDDGLLHLGRLQQIKTLVITQCSLITDAGVAQLRAALPPHSRVRFSLVTRRAARVQNQPHPALQEQDGEDEALGEEVPEGAD